MANLEDVILGCIYFDEKQEFVNLSDIPEDIFSDKIILRKVIAYRKDNKPFDPIIAQEHFTRDEFLRLTVGIQMMQLIHNFPYYLGNFKKQRYEMLLSNQINAGAVNPETVQKYLDVVKNPVGKLKIFNFDSDLQEYLESFEQRLSGKQKMYSFDMDGFREYIGELRTKKFITIGGNSGVGKSNLMLKIMLSLMSQDIPCLFLSSEMGYDDILERMGAMSSTLRYWNIYNARLSPADQEEYIRVLQSCISGKKSYVCEVPIFSIGRIKELIRQTNPKFIFVDFIQSFSLTPGRGETRAGMLSDICSNLKAITMESDCIVIAASQLGMHADRANPTKGDLKESGSIEEKSDIIILLGEIGQDNKFKKIKIDIAKNKHGLEGKFVYSFNRWNCDMKYLATDTEELKKGG
jgi:replicative DNA helicase